MPNQLLGQTPDAYHVLQDGGSVTQIPKAGLSDDTHAMIQGLPPASDPAAASPGPMGPVDMQPPASIARPVPSSPVVASNIPLTNPEVMPPENAQPQSDAPQPPSLMDRIQAQGAAGKHDYGVAMGQANSAIRRQAAAANHLTKAEYGLNQAKVQGLAEEQQTQAKFATTIAEHQAEVEKQATEIKNNFMAQEAKVATMKVDPNRYYANKSTGEKIGAAIAIAMNAFGNGLTHTSGNAAMDIINDAVNKDIQQQVDERESAKGHATNLRGMWHDVVAQGNDKTQSILLAKNMALEAAKTKTMQYIAAAQDPVSKANGEKVIADLSATQAANTRQAVDANNADQTRNLQLQIQAEGQSLDYGAKMAAAAGKAKEGLTIPGLQGAAKTPDAYMKATEIEKNYQRLIPKIHELRELRDKVGTELWTSADAAKAQSLATTIQLALGVANNLGAISGGDFDMIKKIQPSDPTMYGQVAARLDSLEAQLQKDTHTSLRTYGFTNRDKAFDPRFHVEGFVPADAGSDALPSPTSAPEKAPSLSALQNKSDSGSVVMANNQPLSMPDGYSPTMGY